MKSSIGPIGMDREETRGMPERTGIPPTVPEHGRGGKKAPTGSGSAERHSVARTAERSTQGDLAQLLSEARDSIAVVLAGHSQFDRLLMERLKATSPSVTARIMCTSEAVKASGHEGRMLLQSLGEVRVSDTELCGMLAVDSKAAILHVRDQNSTEGQMVTVNDAAAVRALELLSASAWDRSRHLAVNTRLPAQFCTEYSRQMLEFLQAGRTDASAAREINVSLRTYRRHMALLMRELEANSRFQAGARAVELGLL